MEGSGLSPLSIKKLKTKCKTKYKRNVETYCESKLGSNRK